MQRRSFDFLVCLAMVVCAAFGTARAQVPARDSARPPATSAVPARSQLQDAAAQLGISTSPQDIADAIRRSGLSAAEIRVRLAQAGYAPTLADEFLEEGRGVPTGVPARGLTDALKELGLLSAVPTEGAPAKQETDGPKPAERRTTSRVFGASVFARSSSLFDPVASGPVDPSFRVGAGDQLQVVMTGETERAFRLDVQRDGTIIMPQVGSVMLAGLTLEAARAVLRRRATVVFSGIGEGRTALDLSVARVRANAVFVVGEVESPGSYQVNALSTALHAVAKAGGPTERGSLRRIEVRRAGKLVQAVDLYAFLLRGDITGDVRTEQGDVIVVPVRERTVTVGGAVRRPGQFELAAGDRLADVLRFAGGLQPGAAPSRIQIERQTGPDARIGGAARRVFDGAVSRDLATTLAGPELEDGDSITVPAPEDSGRAGVVVAGAVSLPGAYEWSQQLTLRGVIASANGMLPWAERRYAQVVRRDPVTGEQTFLRASLLESAADVPLLPFDSVLVLDARRGQTADSVSATGAVFRAGRYPFIPNATVGDLLDQVGGLRDDAILAELFRRRDSASFSDTAMVVVRAELQGGQLPASFMQEPLKRGDRLAIRAGPGFRRTRTVEVTGLFARPGTYVLASERETVSEIVRASGGLLPIADTSSFRLVRNGLPVAIDFARALRGDRANDLPLLEGDVLRVGRRQLTVTVRGAVERVVTVPYRDGFDMLDYVSAAGGASKVGDPLRAYVEYPSGGIQRIQKRAFFFHSQPPVTAGSIISVPEKPQASDASATQIIAQYLSIASTIASLAIAITVVRR